MFLRSRFLWLNFLVSWLRGCLIFRAVLYEGLRVCEMFHLVMMGEEGVIGGRGKVMERCRFLVDRRLLLCGFI
jgi:hypothetical protein